MNSVNPDHPFLVKLKRGENFAIEEYSAIDIDSAVQLARSFVREDPDLIQIVDRKGTLILSHSAIDEAWDVYCENHRIRQYSFAVDVSI